MKRILRTWSVPLLLGALLLVAAEYEAARPPLAAQQAIDSLWALSFTTGPGWQAGQTPGVQVGFGSHSRNLARLRSAGRILVGGRYGEVGLMLVRAGSEGEVRAMLEPDSAVAAGVFQAAITPWRTIYEGTVPRR